MSRGTISSNGHGRPDPEPARQGEAPPARVRWAVERYERPLMLYASRLTGDVELARDLVQETFLRLCQRPADAGEGAASERAGLEEGRAADDPLAPWLYTVCRRLVIDHRRKETRMTALSAAEQETRASVDPPPTTIAEWREAVTLALRHLDSLPENQQEVVRLKFQHGLSYKQIAQVTELSVGNVGFLLHTALRTLRQRLEEAS